MRWLWRRSADLVNRPVIAHRPPPASQPFALGYLADEVSAFQRRIQQSDAQARSLGDIQIAIADRRRQVR